MVLTKFLELLNYLFHQNQRVRHHLFICLRMLVQFQSFNDNLHSLILLLSNLFNKPETISAHDLKPLLIALNSIFSQFFSFRVNQFNQVAGLVWFQLCNHDEWLHLVQQRPHNQLFVLHWDFMKQLKGFGQIVSLHGVSRHEFIILLLTRLNREPQSLILQPDLEKKRQRLLVKVFNLQWVQIGADLLAHWSVSLVDLPAGWDHLFYLGFGWKKLAAQDLKCLGVSNLELKAGLEELRVIILELQVDAKQITNHQVMHFFDWKVA